MKKIMFSLLAIACAGQAHAYQAEVGGSLDTSDFVDSLSIGGTFYINGVNATTGPFAEAAFLDQSTYVEASFEDRDFGGSNLFGGGRFVDKNSGFFLDGGLQFGDLDGFEIGAGMYLNQNTTVLGFFESNDVVDVFGGKGKYLMPQDDGKYINLEAGFALGDGDFDYSTTEISFDGDYYLDKTMSVGAGISFVSIEQNFNTVILNDFGLLVPIRSSVDDSGILLRAVGQKFLQENISVNGGVTLANLDSGSDFGINVGGKMRF